MVSIKELYYDARPTKSQDTVQLSTENLVGNHEVPVCDIKVGMRRATDVNRIPGTISFLITLHRETTHFLIPVGM